MKTGRYLTTIAVLMLGCLLIHIDSIDIIAQKKPHTIEFSEIRDHLDEYDLRRGDRFVVPSVPFTGDSVYDKVNKLFSLRAGDRSDRGYYYWFHTSPSLANSLRLRLVSGGELSVMLYCVLVEFVDGDYVNKAPFITKAEGFDGHGRSIWIVVGPSPTKLRFFG